jgi:hypothetical protein
LFPTFTISIVINCFYSNWVHWHWFEFLKLSCTIAIISTFSFKKDRKLSEVWQLKDWRINCALFSIYYQYVTSFIAPLLCALCMLHNCLMLGTLKVVTRTNDSIIYRKWVIQVPLPSTWIMCMVIKVLLYLVL